MVNFEIYSPNNLYFPFPAVYAVYKSKDNYSFVHSRAVQEY